MAFIWSLKLLSVSLWIGPYWWNIHHWSKNWLFVLIASNQLLEPRDIMSDNIEVLYIMSSLNSITEQHYLVTFHLNVLGTSVTKLSSCWNNVLKRKLRIPNNWSTNPSQVGERRHWSNWQLYQISRNSLAYHVVRISAIRNGERILSPWTENSLIWRYFLCLNPFPTFWKSLVKISLLAVPDFCACNLATTQSVLTTLLNFWNWYQTSLSICRKVEWVTHHFTS